MVKSKSEVARSFRIEFAGLTEYEVKRLLEALPCTGTVSGSFSVMENVESEPTAEHEKEEPPLLIPIPAGKTIADVASQF